VDSLYEIIIEPCYIIYNNEQYTTMLRMHTLWKDYQTDWNNGDTQVVAQAWHGIQALVQLFRDRNEWDEDNREPMPFFRVEEEEKHYHEIDCFFCHCHCSWNESSFGRWDGECPACGTVLEPSKVKEAS